MPARIAPQMPPYPTEVQAWLDRIMPPGRPPLALFTTLARDPRLFGKFFAGGLLDRGNLTLRQRELVIARTARGAPDDACWSEEDRALLRLCDALHRTCTIDDALWQTLRTTFSEEAMLELLLLAGFYRTVSYLTNALQLPLEAGSARFPTAEAAAIAS